MARDFNGSTQYAENATAVAGTFPFTISAWFNPDSATAAMAIASIGNDASATSDVLGLLLGGTAVSPNTRVIAYSAAAGAGTQAFASSSYSTGSWQHGAAVFASTTSRTAYYNGGNSGADATSSNPANRNVTNVATAFAGTTNGHIFLFDGRIAEVGFWNVALGADEIGVLGLGVSPLLVRPQSLVAYYPLVGRYSPEIDLKGGLGLTLTNSPVVADHCRIIQPKPPAYAPRSPRTLAMTAAAGAFTLAGQAAGLRADRRVTAAAGAFAETGNAASLLAARKISGSAGDFALTGNAANLIYTPTPHPWEGVIIRSMVRR